MFAVLGSCGLSRVSLEWCYFSVALSNLLLASRLPSEIWINHLLPLWMIVQANRLVFRRFQTLLFNRQLVLSNNNSTDRSPRGSLQPALQLASFFSLFLKCPERSGWRQLTPFNHPHTHISTPPRAKVQLKPLSSLCLTWERENLISKLYRSDYKVKQWQTAPSGNVLDLIQ